MVPFGILVRRENYIMPIQCRICGRMFDRCVTYSHIKVCGGISTTEYKQKFDCHTHSNEYRKELSEHQKRNSNLPHIKEQRKNMMKKRWQNPEYAIRQTMLANTKESQYKRQKTLKDRFANEPDFYNKIRKILNTDEVRKKQSESAKRHYPIVKYALAAGQVYTMTRIHKLVKSVLNDLGFTSFESEKVIGKFQCDEVDSANKIIIEANGCFWHGCTICYSAEELNRYDKAKIHAKRHREKVRILQSLGWRVIEVYEHDNVRNIIENELINNREDNE